MTTKLMAMLAGAALLAAAPAMGQVQDAAPAQRVPVPDQAQAPGGVMDDLGDVVAGPFDIQGPTGDNRILGVTFAFGHYWLSGTGAAPAPGSQRIHKFDVNGNFIKSYPQVTNSPGGAFWGGRDGAADEANNRLYFGAEGGEVSEYEYNPATGDIAHVKLHKIPIGNTVRALARNPDTGNFYSADFTLNPIIEFQLDPPVLINSWPNIQGPGNTPLAYYGFAWDDVNDTLWGWSQNGPPPLNPANQRVLATEIDPNGMTATGRTFFGIVYPAGAPTTQNNIAGGAHIICNLPQNPGKISLAAVHQALNDALIVYDIGDPCGAECYADCDGNGVLNIDDFICFQLEFALQTPYADCDGNQVFNIDDFICFQLAFALGC